MKYLSNAFSLQMLPGVISGNWGLATVTVDKVAPPEVPADVMSYIGHQDTAAVVSDILGRNIPANRGNIALEYGDVLYVAQITGGRLPEGSTTLPEGYEIVFLRVTVE